MKILVIDDDIHTGVIIARALRDSIVLLELDAAAGLAHFVSAYVSGEPFDLVFSAATLRGINGCQVLTAVRAHGEPPIVILIVEPKTTLDADADRADGVLMRPFTDYAVRFVVQRAQMARAAVQTQRISRFPREFDAELAE